MTTGKAKEIQVGHHVGEIDLDKYSNDGRGSQAATLHVSGIGDDGGLKALQVRNGTATVPKAGEPSDVQARRHGPKGLSQVATLELTQNLSDDDDSALEQTLAQSDKTKGVDGAMGNKMVDEDNGDVSTSQRPNKAKRAIVFGDMGTLLAADQRNEG
ncbi:hypothetical protein B0O80DRAFT_491882 [Mortierella sp. GBAus27b]|nr:hypothetical protein B0O80DRAFT_491882 [Mortierella sp. GBAus27b]